MVRELFGANLKMNPVYDCETSLGPVDFNSGSLFEKLLRGYVDEDVCGNEYREIVVFCPDLFLGYFNNDGRENFHDILDNADIKLGAQDVSEHESGAHTGETSPLWLKELRVEYVLVGHSEVRERYERVSNCNYPMINSIFNKKIKCAQRNGLRTLYCIGETQDEKNEGLTEKVLASQLGSGLRDIDPGLLCIAYEPRWAIGTGKIPTEDEIRDAHERIRFHMEKIYSPHHKKLQIVYGGSMNPDNVCDIMSIKRSDESPAVNGGLVGGACLDAEEFSRICNYRDRM
ncbi:triosephosphate isomerase [Candidatus Pacearchaeota archaeon]|nr:triosephosphate isomerase [Candidatus Pacearchaeota archaeon]